LPMVASVTDSPSVGTRISAMIVFPFRHARACRGHPRLCDTTARTTWMAGTSPAMTQQ
jgi:hypothetical protein